MTFIPKKESKIGYPSGNCVTSVPTEEEINREMTVLIKNAEKVALESYVNFYKPTVEALTIYGPLTAEDVSRITGRSASEEKTYLEMLYGSGFVDKQEDAYRMKAKVSEIEKFFGVG